MKNDKYYYKNFGKKRDGDKRVVDIINGKPY